jgi:predicted Zn-dependent peptidase
LQKIIEKVEAVTREDILALANDLFHPRQMALTLLGPVNKDKKELEEILFDPGRS